MTVQQALAHPWIKGHAQLPDKPLSSIMLTRLKQFTQMSKLKCAAAAQVYSSFSSQCSCAHPILRSLHGANICAVVDASRPAMQTMRHI